MALISSALFAQDSINQGIAAFRNGNYKQAAEFFEQAVSSEPNNATAHTYLGTAYMSMWVPGSDSPNAHLAETEFQRVLELDPNNKTALASMASLKYNEAASLRPHEKLLMLDQSLEWYKRLAAVDPNNKEAFYSMGVIAWSKWYPAFSEARKEAGLKPEDPGPLPDGPRKQELKAQYSSILEDGLANLARALQIYPGYSDAMAYTNLLIRERADLKDTKEEYLADVKTANEWVGKALEAKKTQTQFTEAPAPPPPPPAPALGATPAAPQRIRVGANVQAQNLIYRADPIYPPLAAQARIQGTVRFTAIIGKDGTMQNIQLISGHPLLVVAAKEAVQQYRYKPTLLNGIPVEVITTIDVHFALAN
jgi:TonB family protein